ncbi:MAG: hypothetical protein IKV94_03915 [Clostridia bacterium]|nr:hypothetical protein [Clostridia bacterium]
MQQDIENVVNKFIDKTKEYAKSIEKEAKVIKQYNKNRDNGYKTISSVIELDGFKVRFAYHVNEGIGFKKGIVTVFYNIGNLEYHAYDVLKQIAPKDKKSLVFPYVDDEEVIDKCMTILTDTVEQYKENITELSKNPEEVNKLEKDLKKEIKQFIGKNLDGAPVPLQLLISGVYNISLLLRYTSEPYEAFLQGNYKKAIRLYNKETNLTIYEKQLVKSIKQEEKNKNKTKSTENYYTNNRKKEAEKGNFIYSLLSFLLSIPVVSILSLLLYALFVYVMTSRAIVTLNTSLIFLIVPIIFASIAVYKPVRDKIFASKMKQYMQLQVLFNTKQAKRSKLNIFNAILISCIISIAMIASTSLTAREDGIKYSKEIWDVKGTLVSYNEIQHFDLNKKQLILEKDEVIDLSVYDISNVKLEELVKVLENKNVKIE